MREKKGREKKSNIWPYFLFLKNVNQDKEVFFNYNSSFRFHFIHFLFFLSSFSLIFFLSSFFPFSSPLFLSFFFLNKKKIGKEKKEKIIPTYQTKLSILSVWNFLCIFCIGNKERERKKGRERKQEKERKRIEKLTILSFHTNQIRSAEKSFFFFLFLFSLFLSELSLPQKRKKERKKVKEKLNLKLIPFLSRKKFFNQKRDLVKNPEFQFLPISSSSSLSLFLLSFFLFFFFFFSLSSKSGWKVEEKEISLINHDLLPLRESAFTLFTLSLSLSLFLSFPLLLSLSLSPCLSFFLSLFPSLSSFLSIFLPKKPQNQFGVCNSSPPLFIPFVTCGFSLFLFFFRENCEKKREKGKERS